MLYAAIKKSSYLLPVAVDMWGQQVVALWAAGRLISEGLTSTHPSQSFERNRSPIFCFVILPVMVLNHYKTEKEKRNRRRFLYCFTHLHNYMMQQGFS